MRVYNKLVQNMNNKLNCPYCASFTRRLYLGSPWIFKGLEENENRGVKDLRVISRSTVHEYWVDLELVETHVIGQVLIDLNKKYGRF